MAAELLTQHKKSIQSFELVPEGGGVFELTVDGKLLFSKKQLARFPEPGEVQKLMASPAGK